MHILEVTFSFYDVEWATDDLLMDIGDIECDESERHEGDTEYPGIEDDDEDDVGEEELIDRELIDDDDECHDRGYRRDSESEEAYQLEREEGESHQIVQGKTYELLVPIARLSRESLSCVEHQCIPRVSHPVDKTSVHTILLPESQI